MTTPDPSDLIGTLNESVAERLRAFGILCDPVPVPVLTERHSDLESKLSVALKQKGGMCVLLATPTWRIGESETELVVSLVIHVTENVLINQGATGTRKGASYFALMIYAYLLGFAAPGWSTLIRPADDTAARLVSSSPVVTYEVALQCQTFITLESATA